jgi:D-xylose transport system permease protein
MIGRLSLRNLSMAAALVLIAAFFSLHPDGGSFLSPENLSNLSIELAITATLALGMLLVLLPGMIDLSVGSGVGMLGGLAAVLIIKAGFSAPVSLALTTLVALGTWALMGALIVKQKVPSFIITLGGLLVFQGLHWLIIRNATIPVAPGGTENILSLLTTYYLPPWAGYALVVATVVVLAAATLAGRRGRIAHGLPADDREMAFLKLLCAAQGLFLLVIVMNGYKGVPLSLVILGVVLTGIYVLTRHTRFGRYLYAIGGNEEAARLSGIAVDRVVIGAYVILGAITALTGFLQTAYGGYSTTTVGKLMELDAIAACVIGGTSLKGGRGTVLGVLFGALIMAVLLNGMTLIAVSPEKKVIARGVVLVLAVWMDVALARARKTT